MYEARFKVRSTQVDLFGHLNNAAYLEIYEWARWEWSAAMGVDLQSIMEVQRLGPAILHIDLSFQKEIRFQEEITVRTWFHSLDEIKGVIAQEMLKGEGILASRVLVTFVMFDLKSRKVLAMPEIMRRLYEADEEYRCQLRGGSSQA